MDNPNDEHQDSDHPAADIPHATESLPDDAQFEESVALPNVAAEEDASEGEPVDIDAQLDSIGHKRDHD